MSQDQVADAATNDSDDPSSLALQVSNLVKSYRSDLWAKKQTVLDGLSLDFPAHRCVGLLGHNGAGKTTTIRLVMGLLQPDRGSIRIFGQIPRVQTRRLIGYMPESNKLPLDLTCVEAISFQHRLMGTGLNAAERKEIENETLEKVGLWQARRKRIRKLSKGMGRRLAWAFATIHRPKLLILDEPFSGMDPLGRSQMEGWIDSMKSSASIVLCTHEMDTVGKICNDYHILQQGRLVYSTLDPTQRDSKVSYAVQVSGIREQDLVGLKSLGSLGNWQGLHQRGHVTELRFADYGVAAKWVSTLIEQGYVVVRFYDDMGLTQEQLLEFFRVGSVP